MADASLNGGCIIASLTVPLTLLALIAFASNSLLTRLALGSHAIGPAAFTATRFLSGTVTLALLARVNQGGWRSLAPTGFAGPLSLVAYAAPFSFAYTRIGAATGALILFGAAQVTMLAFAVWKGERPMPLTWVGLAAALAGLGFLTLGAAAPPDPVGVLLMSVAGVAWGAYSIAGRMETDPVLSNARSFVWSSPMMLLLLFVPAESATVTTRGLVLGLSSGILATAGGYIVWYRALRGLAMTAAAVAQLSVPVIAALGAIVILDEPLTVRFAVSAVTVLGGIALVVFSRRRRQ